VTQVTLSKLLKAIYGGALAFLTGLSTVLTGDASMAAVTDGQWVVIAAWTLAAFGSVYGLAGWSGPPLNGNRRGNG
jgi:thiosulfate reductase cytochrome b subunit